jgi:hypothetical protein
MATMLSGSWERSPLTTGKTLVGGPLVISGVTGQGDPRLTILLKMPPPVFIGVKENASMSC